VSVSYLPNENNLRVRVIDDEFSIRESQTSHLRSAGLNVQTFSWAQEFFNRPPLEAFGCLVLDEQLPRISGLG
jgi:two-component system, LuxR family, response regulator FixJ